jgi:hypothetical protein
MGMKIVFLPKWVNWEPAQVGGVWWRERELKQCRGTVYKVKIY